MHSSKTPNKSIQRKVLNILAIVLISTISFTNTGCNSIDKNRSAIKENKAAVIAHNSPFDRYIQNRQKNLTILSSSHRDVRQRALNEIKTNPLYKVLVDQKSVDQKYLPVLQSIGNTVISEHNDYFELLESNENSLKTIPGALKFTINCIQLDMYGGLPNEILDIYSRYINRFRTSGSKGTTIYDANGSDKIIIESDFTLIEALTAFQYNYPEILDNYYEAVNAGIIKWQGGKGADYKYDYLNTKAAFNKYLKKNCPNSKSYVHYDIATTAQNLYAEYDANEVIADEKYKNKQVAVKGTVTKIAKDILDNSFINLSADDFGEIHCSFKENKALRKLSKGDYVIVVGTCTGKISIVVGLTDCELF